MKNTMSLENYGVAEMTTREMRATNGGWIHLAIAGFAIWALAEGVTNPKASLDAFTSGIQEGWDSMSEQ